MLKYFVLFQFNMQEQAFCMVIHRGGGATNGNISKHFSVSVIRDRPIQWHDSGMKLGLSDQWQTGGMFVVQKWHTSALSLAIQSS